MIIIKAIFREMRKEEGYERMSPKEVEKYVLDRLDFLKKEQEKDNNIVFNLNKLGHN